jgi:hypothetical protein
MCETVIKCVTKVTYVFTLADKTVSVTHSWWHCKWFMVLTLHIKWYYFHTPWDLGVKGMNVGDNHSC